MASPPFLSPEVSATSASRYIPLQYGDVDNRAGLQLTTGTLLRLMQAPRMDLPFVGPEYSFFSEQEPVKRRRLVVKTQMVRMEPGALQAAAKAKTLKVTVDLGQVGGSTIE